VRVKLGLTYGIGGYFAARQHASEFMISTFSKNASTADAIRAILGEIDRLRDEPPSADELALMRGYVTGSSVMRSETPQEVVDELWLLESYGLPDDYLEQMLKKVAAAEADDAIKAARELVDPDQLVIVVAGSPDALKDDLEAIAPVTVVK